jgi:hypothetical protein
MPSSTAGMYISDEKFVPPSSAIRLALSQRAVELQNDEVEFDKLVNSNEEKRVVEKKKYAIMQKVYASINRETEVKPEPQETAALWRRALLLFLITIDIAMISVWGLRGTVDLLKALVPKIPMGIALFISTIATSIEGIILCSLLKPYLQRGLEIEPDATEDTLADSYDNRLKLIEKMNSSMITDICSNSADDYGSYASILKKFNQDMKRTQLTDYSESTAKRRGRYCLSIIDIGVNITGAYFGSTTLLTTLGATSLIGTPIGWGIIIVLIATQLFVSFLMRKDSVYSWLHPRKPQYEATQKKLINFKDRSDEIQTLCNNLQERKNPNLSSSQTSTTASPALSGSSRSNTTTPTIASTEYLSFLPPPAAKNRSEAIAPHRLSALPLS